MAATAIAKKQWFSLKHEYDIYSESVCMQEYCTAHTYTHTHTNIENAKSNEKTKK